MFKTLAVFQPARFWLKADAKANVCEQTQMLRAPHRTTMHATQRSDGRCGSIQSQERSAAPEHRAPKHGSQTHGRKCLHEWERADAGRKGRDQAIDATPTKSKAQSYGRGIPPPCSKHWPCSTY